MNTRLRSFLPLIVLMAVACGDAVSPDDGTSVGTRASPWMSGTLATRGHEDVLRFGVIKGNDLINNQLGLTGLFPLVTEGAACLTTGNELLKGNCHTDFPDDEMTTYYGVSSSDFGDHPDLQDLHALRNFVGDQAVSGKYACAGMKARIVNSTQRGLTFWQQGDMNAAMRWIGHATHTVQDSFTPAHCERQGARYETMTDVCTYGIDVPGVCLHSKPDLRDRIWQTTFTCTVTSERPWNCLVPEAQAASNATAGYLLVVGRLIKAEDWDGASAALETWFSGDPTNPESGYFLCNGLKNDGWEPAPDAGVDAEAGTPEASAEASAEASTGDGGDVQDAADEGNVLDGSPYEASVEPSPEAGPEASIDAGPEASVDAGADAQSTDAQSDAAPKPDAAVQKDAATAEAGNPGTTDDEAEADGGCGCRTAGATGSSSAAWLALGGLGLLIAARRRSR